MFYYLKLNSMKVYHFIKKHRQNEILGCVFRGKFKRLADV